jgi:hypothetical protein
MTIQAILLRGGFFVFGYAADAQGQVVFPNIVLHIWVNQLTSSSPK